MKLFILLFGFIFQAKGFIPNIPYGQDPAQVFDLYIPTKPTENDTKVVVVIHGGGWSGGEKSGMNGYAWWFQQVLPGHYLANMEYRLGTNESPGFPKQLQDIYYLMAYIKATFAQNVTFALLGVSAGGHLSMLYDYGYDSLLGDQVKAVVTIVGPTDLTDSNYTSNRAFDPLFYNLVGPCKYSECPEKYVMNSPASVVHKGAAPTMGFYGNQDPLIPNSQMTTLKNKLDGLGVINNFTVYNAGHANWGWNDQIDMIFKIGEFLKTNWKT